jgi:uncharacterized protein YdcH (DUF465 family)
MPDNYNPTEAQIEQFITQYGDDSGHIEDDVMASFMAGDIELEPITESDTGEAEQDAADASQEDSQPSDADKDENVAVSDDDPGADAAGQKADKDPDGKEEPVILAKDGKNTIPFSALEELREQMSALKAQNDELKTLLESRPNLEGDIAKAAADDQSAGNTDATELLLESLDENLEEDYPGITEKLKAQLLVPLQDKLNKIDELIADKAERDVRTNEEKAQDEYNNEVQAFEARYVTALNQDKDAFWKWFDAQPSYVRAAETSGVPEQFAEVVKAFYDQHEPEPKREPKVDAKDVKDSVDKAKAKADAKDSVPSLSAIPGGKNPEHDENEAILKMTPMELAEKFKEFSPEQVESYMARVL